jgi:hypothetical protein
MDCFWDFGYQEFIGWIGAYLNGVVGISRIRE